MAIMSETPLTKDIATAQVTAARPLQLVTHAPILRPRFRLPPKLAHSDSTAQLVPPAAMNNCRHKSCTKPGTRPRGGASHRRDTGVNLGLLRVGDARILVQGRCR